MLLILAGVTVATLTGENGLLAKAQLAKEKTAEAEEDEREKLNTLENLINGRNQQQEGNIQVDNELSEFLSNTNYEMTLKDLLTSEEAISKLVQNTTSVDYILSNCTKYKNDLVNSQAFLKTFSSNEYAWNKMVSNSNWTTAILASETARNILDNSNPVTVPTMTSNTTPSGEAFASSSFETYDVLPYRVFDGTTEGEDYWNPAANASYKDQYVGYDFGTAIWVYKIVAHVSNGKQNSDYVIEGSNEKTTGYEIIKDGLHQSGRKDTIIPNNYNKKFRYYRVRFLSEIAQSGSGNTCIITLQFYGK